MYLIREKFAFNDPDLGPLTTRFALTTDETSELAACQVQVGERWEEASDEITQAVALALEDTGAWNDVEDLAHDRVHTGQLEFFTEDEAVEELPEGWAV